MNLATIQRVINIEPIPGADNIVKMTLLGWTIVVKKDEFKVNDLCCYISIDTVVPEKPYFEFLRERKFRIKTIKLRGQLSQGLAIPLNSLPELKGKWNEGDDVTELIGVKKYEKPDNNPLEKYEKSRVPKVWYKKWVYLFKYNILYKVFPGLRRKLRSPFPTHLVSITEEERIQNMPQVLQAYKGKEFILSYKLDGSSITIIHQKVLGISKYRICSRRFELHDKNNDWYKVFKSSGIEKSIQTLASFFETSDIIVQGEAIGKFNGNHHALREEEIRLFNIYVDGKRLKQDQFIDICESLKIPHCPIYKKVVLDHSLEEVLKMSEIKDILNPKVEAEGIVWRSTEDNLSFKAINNLYLLKEK